MKVMRVIAPQGATIRGPAELGLFPDQAKRRAAFLKPLKRKHTYLLEEGVAVTLKCGEVFGLKQDGKLNGLLFEEVDIEAEAEAKAKAEAEAKARAEGKME